MSFEERQKIVVEVCTSILKGADGKTLIGEAAEWAVFQGRVLNKLSNFGHSRSQDDVVATAMAIVEGTCCGIEDIEYIKPKNSNVESDQAYLEKHWNAATHLLAEAITQCTDQQYIAKVQQEVMGMISNMKSSKGTDMGNVSDLLHDACFDEVYKEAFNKRSKGDCFWQRLKEMEMAYRRMGRNDTTQTNVTHVSTPGTGRTNSQSTAAAPVIDRQIRTPKKLADLLGPESSVNKKRSAMMTLSRGVAGSTGKSNGFLMYYCVRDITMRTEPEQKSKLMQALNELIAKSFYKSMLWSDWCQCVTTLLTLLSDMGWAGSERDIAENLATDIESDVITSTMRNEMRIQNVCASKQ